MATAAFLLTVDSALTAAEAATLATMSSDLAFILGENDVPLKLQVAIGSMGFKTLTLFAVMADDRAGIRANCATVLNLNHAEAHLTPAHVAKAILHTAQVCASWHSAMNRFTEAEKVAADSRAQRLPMIVPRALLISMRKKYELTNGKVNESTWPCASLIEKVLEEVEEGSFSALSLTEVISADKGSEDLMPILDLSQALKVRKMPKAIALPLTTEEFRTRMKTLAITYVLASYKHASRLWLKTSTMALWLEFTEHVLGDTVARYATQVEGQAVRASWETVLSYELNMRKLACKRVLYQDEDIATAVRFAMKDLETKEQWFITPTAFALSRPGARAMPPAGQQAPTTSPGNEANKRKREAWSERKDRRAEAKGGGKGKKGAKGLGKKEQAAAYADLKTPEGRSICRNYQTDACTFKDKCRFVHVCSICYGEHPAAACPKKGAI
jgi:hypothetical protein